MFKQETKVSSLKEKIPISDSEEDHPKVNVGKLELLQESTDQEMEFRGSFEQNSQVSSIKRFEQAANEHLPIPSLALPQSRVSAEIET